MIGGVKMPYSSNDELPKSVKVLPSAAQTVWRNVMNDELKKGTSEESAIKIAWTAVKNGWEKNDKGEWVKKMKKELFQFKSVEDCPNGIKNLSKEAQKQWMEIANALLKAGDNKQYACSRAWLSIQEGWTKNDEGEWGPNVPNIVTPQDIPMFSKELSLEDATKELKGVQVFETGTWNGGKYTEKDLEEMVNNFGVVDAPLKIGHDAKQKIAGQPAVGWITKLYKKGKKLYADIKGIPKTVYELIKKGAYKKRSAELYYNVVDSMGNKLNNVFGGLALLGAELPAINTLADVVALYGYETDDKNKRIVIFEIQGGTDMGEIKDETKVEETEVKDEVKEENMAADDKPVEEVKSDEKPADEVKTEGDTETVVEENDKAADESGKVDDVVKENLSLKAELAKVNAEKEETELKAFMKKIERKIPPVIAPMVFELLKKSDNAVKIEFALKDKKVEETNRGFIMQMFSAMPEMAILKGVTEKVEENVTKQHKAVMEANKIVTSDGITFKDALLKVYQQNPDLIEQAKTVTN